MKKYQSTKIIELGSCAFRQWRASHSHCHFLHGYQLKAKFWFGSSGLDEKNWVVDFGGLKELKAKLQNVFDHTLCVAADDPCLDLFMELEKRGAVQLRVFEKGVGIERSAELCYEIATAFLKEKYGERCWVDRVEVFEHEDNSATFSTESVIATSMYDSAVLESNIVNAVVAAESYSAAEVAAPEPVRDRAAPLTCKTDKSLAEILAGK